MEGILHPQASMQTNFPLLRATKFDIRYLWSIIGYGWFAKALAWITKGGGEGMDRTARHGAGSYAPTATVQREGQNLPGSRLTQHLETWA